jgi:hypothetical protein
MSSSSVKSLSACIPSILLIPHYKYYLQVLFDGSFPVFVAVTISNGVTSFIHAIASSSAIDDETSLIIALNFIYSLFFGYILGVYIMVNSSSMTYLQKFSTYIHSVAIENASFAWFSTVSLIILKRVYDGSSHNFGDAFAAWLVTVFIVILIIYVTNIGRRIYRGKNIDEKIVSNLIEFDSGSFSLAIAFGFTIIIAAAIVSNESTNYLSGVDDVTSTNDDSGDGHDVSIPYIAYVFFITGLVVGYEYYRIYREEVIEARLQANESIQDKSSSSTSNFLSHFIKKVDSMFFAWDERNITKKTLSELFAAIRGDLVTCAWYSWSILAFQVCSSIHSSIIHSRC